MRRMWLKWAASHPGDVIIPDFLIDQSQSAYLDDTSAPDHLNQSSSSNDISSSNDSSMRGACGGQPLHLKGQSPKCLGQNPEQFYDIDKLLISEGVSLQIESLPPGVLKNVGLYYCCGRCGKIYWDGSHFSKVCEQLSKVIVE